MRFTRDTANRSAPWLGLYITNTMKIYYLQYQSEPSPESKDSDRIGGAFINCWIKAGSLDAAKDLAQNSIRNNNWIILSLEESYVVDSDYYRENKESLEYYEQAITDGEVYVYHSWPNQPQEDGIVH